MQFQIISEKTPEDTYAAAAPSIAESIVATIKKQGFCILGIVGGRSIPGIFENLLQHAPQIKGTKGNLHVFWLDERVQGEKNYVDAIPYLEELKALGVHVSWHPLDSTDHDDIQQQARGTLDEMTRIAGVPKFDVVIVSSGEDGHICGLFPEQETTGIAIPGYVVIHNAPKPPPLRITVTPPLLLSAKIAFLFFVGDKKKAYEQFLKDKSSPDEWPVKLIAQIPAVHVFTCLK